MSAAILEAVLEGGPGDGVTFQVAEDVGYLLATLAEEIHGYEWAGRSERGGGRWVFRHRGQVSRVGGAKPASEVLRGAGTPHVALAVVPSSVRETMEGGGA